VDSVLLDANPTIPVNPIHPVNPISLDLPNIDAALFEAPAAARLQMPEPTPARQGSWLETTQASSHLNSWSPM
jgi:hypothetical protein